MLHMLLLLSLLLVLCHGQASQEVSAEDFEVEKMDPAADGDLVGSGGSAGSDPQPCFFHRERGSIRLCGMRDRCAMKFGPRIGKLCDCGRGANCNSYLLKCI